MAKQDNIVPSVPVQHVSSESDLANLDPENTFSYVGRRQKRFRGTEVYDQPENDSLKEELLSMLTSWKKELDKTLNTLCADISVLKQQNSNIQATNSEMEKAMQFMSMQYEEMKERLISMEKERKENLTYISSLENKIDDLEKRLKSTVIEFRNMPVLVQKVKQESQRDLTELVQKTCTILKVNINPSDIKDIYRVKNKTGSSIVVAELTTVLTKNKIISSVKEFNKINTNNKLSSSTIGIPGPAVPVYVSESLTNKNRKLLAITRENRKALGYEYCWTSNGRVYLRKAEGSPRVEIKNENDLASLKKQ